MRASLARSQQLSAIAILIAACSSTAPSDPPTPSVAPATMSPSSAAPSSSAVADPWSEDLGQLDAAVRASHPDPFAIHPESAWTARLAEIRMTLPTATPDEQLVQLASLIGLLDTHSWVGPPARFDRARRPDVTRLG